TEAGRLEFTTDKAAAYRDAEAIFSCVGPPSDTDGSADLQYVLRVAEDIAGVIDSLGPDQSPKTVVVKSTVPVGTSHQVRDLIKGRTDAPFHIADNPEFLKEGDAINDFMKPDRVVCGIESEGAETAMRELYEPFVRQGNPIYMMDVRSAEMVKYASNAMLACKISFVNEIARLCESYGADIKNVREGMCADRRIGNQFLYPGLGYGGSCFPKDTLAVCSMGRQAGLPCKLNEAVHEVNQEQRSWFWGKITDVLGTDLSGKTLAFWGVSFKPKTDDIREAPAIALMARAVEAGAKVKAFCPEGLEHLQQDFPAAEHASGMYECLAGADALVVCTEWNEFRSPDFEKVGAMLSSRMIFDGRNVYRRQQMAELGFTYISVGRPPVLPANSGANA
ncbi:MAG: UDP-glucose/GDP-mannose dehydrogenase family protein, partial [Planctomycetota bacterium]|nr:UDP-glucose/GDP-mannose dehydrogenase family protein [Planctomycetota bacterium]